jgi:hypothetical protein
MDWSSAEAAWWMEAGAIDGGGIGKHGLVVNSNEGRRKNRCIKPFFTSRWHIAVN